MAKPVNPKRDEFFENLWDHTTDAFQVQFDDRRPLDAAELAALRKVLSAFKTGKSDEEVATLVKQLVDGQSEGQDLMALLLQITGGTRNKIISDLKAMAASAKFTAPSSYAGLTKPSAWKVAGPYLAERLRNVMVPVAKESVEGVLEALNQATYPGFIRQQRAKTQGHEAERRLAAVMLACNIPFAPAEKATNPMCPDIILGNAPDDASFDLIVPNARQPILCVKSTVHTSNIGQYGESKDDLEVGHAQKVLTKLYGKRKPVLLALIDGVGFRSNSAGLNGVLEKADVFCQFKTLWKAVVVAAAGLGIKRRIELSAKTKAAHLSFLDEFGYAANVVAPGKLKEFVEVGEARVEP